MKPEATSSRSRRLPGFLVFLAEVLDASVDYLLTGDASEDVPLHNTRLLEHFRALTDFEADDQEAVIKLIDAMIVKRKVEGAVQPFERAAAERGR